MTEDAEIPDDFMFPAEVADEDPIIVDPVRTAAELLVAAVVARDPSIATTATLKGAVIVLITSVAWLEVTAVAWRSRILGQPPTVAEVGSYLSRKDREKAAHDWPLGVTEDKGHRTMLDDADVKRALCSCQGLLISTADLDLVSPSLRASADLVVKISAPTPAVLKSVAEGVSTGIGTMLDEKLATFVIPDHLLACLRSGQSAAEYLARLARVVAATRPEPPAMKEARWTLDNLPLPDAVEAWGRHLMTDLADYRSGQIEWDDVDKGVLLFGPPGCGKTTFAGALAASCGVPLIVGGYSTWDSGDDGKSNYANLIKNMRASFKKARDQAPSIMFIDEVDSFMARGKAGHNESWFRPIVNALLAELDGIGGREGVIVVAATNLIDEIDVALKRAGRLDRELHLSLPDLAMMVRILLEHIPELPREALSTVAPEMAGRSGADVEQVARGARRTARRERRRVTVDDLMKEVRPAMPPMDEELRRRIAVHEAGHALCTVLQDPGGLIVVSIRAGTAGHNTEGGCAARKTEDLDILLCRLFGGRAAEEIVFGKPGLGSGGPAQSDLALATLAAARAESAFGFGNRLTWMGYPTPETLPQFLLLNRDLAERVEQRLSSAMAASRKLLKGNRLKLEALVSALVARETLTGVDVSAVIGGKPRHGAKTQDVQMDDRSQPEGCERL